MNEDVYIPLSYISQYNYCHRRAGLLLLRGQWTENAYTASGRAGHEKVHDCRIERRGNMSFLYETTLFSRRLKLTGKSDCIEATSSDYGIELPLFNGKWLLYPIEYKNGVVRDEYEYKLQLTAQAMCLDEMLGCKIERGAIFYINSHRRDEVNITDKMRNEVISTSKALHEMLHTGGVEKAEWSKKCLKCSMLDCCCPKLKSRTKSYINGIYESTKECDV